jgi:hypothetical protein
MTEDDKTLVERLRDDWPEILVEKHWMMDSDAIDKQREEAADRIEDLIAENERLKYLNDLNAVPAGIIEDRGRMEERAAIIAWLEKESTLCDCAAIYDGECVCGALDECKTVPIERILLAIEAGKHLK